GRFDTAATEFQKAIEFNRLGHEAHFGFALAVHRIQLLDIGDNNKEQDSFNKIPIYYEIEDDLYSENAFENDTHYKNAIKYSENFPEIQNKYRTCAKKIKDIIRAFRRYSREKRIYDCFICAKVTELDSAGKPINGKQTDDCKWAKELHQKLKKLNPFFSECDIEGQAEVAGTKYEALILYALIHSKCMVIVCSDQKYLDNSRYMQNEYRRFCGFLKGRGKELDNIYLVRKTDDINLPNRGKTQDCIRSGDNKAYQKVIDYVQLKVEGKAPDPSTKKYCIKCGKSFDPTIYLACRYCKEKLVSFDVYEEFKRDELNKEIERQKDEAQRILQEAQDEVQKQLTEVEGIRRRNEEDRKTIEEERRRLQEEKKVKDETVFALKKYNYGELFYGETINPIPLCDVVIPENCSKSVRRLYKSAKRGVRSSQYKLGRKYYFGQGVESDCKQGVEWYYRAARSGYTDAQYSLGECYYFGRGVNRDYKNSVKWFMLAAEKNHFEAQQRLADCYYEGKGVEQDFEIAVFWYKKLAGHGDKAACNCVAECYEKGLGVEVDNQKALEWEQRPSMLKRNGIIKWSVEAAFAIVSLVLYIILMAVFYGQVKI
ncbi:MAG: toll/interleukin-1 receptor domain-containing protein, partial [Allobaculum sp.]|nr:toll/interleukin-1 receptor domain-containing protein [Allobaculum sp.]